MAANMIEMDHQGSEMIEIKEELIEHLEIKTEPLDEDWEDTFLNRDGLKQVNVKEEPHFEIPEEPDLAPLTPQPATRIKSETSLDPLTTDDHIPSKEDLLYGNKCSVNPLLEDENTDALKCEPPNITQVDFLGSDILRELLSLPIPPSNSAQTDALLRAKNLLGQPGPTSLPLDGVRRGGPLFNQSVALLGAGTPMCVIPREIGLRYLVSPPPAVVEPPKDPTRQDKLKHLKSQLLKHLHRLKKLRLSDEELEKRRTRRTVVRIAQPQEEEQQEEEETSHVDILRCPEDLIQLVEGQLPPKASKRRKEGDKVRKPKRRTEGEKAAKPKPKRRAEDDGVPKPELQAEDSKVPKPEAEENEVPKPKRRRPKAKKRRIQGEGGDAEPTPPWVGSFWGCSQCRETHFSSERELTNHKAAVHPSEPMVAYFVSSASSPTSDVPTVTTSNISSNGSTKLVEYVMSSESSIKSVRRPLPAMPDHLRSLILDKIQALTREGEGLGSTEGEGLSSTRKSSVCDFCGKVFVHLGDFNKHRRSHTGERPHVCDIGDCRTSFATHSNLSRHRRLHLGVKFRCSLCNVAYSRRDKLVSHSKICLAKWQVAIQGSSNYSGVNPSEGSSEAKAMFKLSAKEVLKLGTPGRRGIVFMCQTCKETFSNVWEFLEHRDSHSEPSDKTASGDSDTPTEVLATSVELAKLVATSSESDTVAEVLPTSEIATVKSARLVATSGESDGDHAHS